LAGALNGAVLRAVYRDMRETEGARVIAVGRKAHDFFIAHSIPIEAYYPNNDRVSSEFINELVQTSAQKFANEEVDAVKIAYQNFISTFEQRPTIRTIFPLTLGELQRVVDDILPVRGVFSSKPSDEQPITYTIEPSEEEVLGVVLPRLASIFVYHALLESLASEHSARMTAMKSASDKAEELTHKLTIDFNKARQAAITREVSELTSGIEAMAN
jgi:F-type H+-transporting ATPase subunit gamma